MSEPMLVKQKAGETCPFIAYVSTGRQTEATYHGDSIVAELRLIT